MPRETGRTGFKSHLVRRLEDLFPDAVLLTGNSAYRQGIPDLLLLLPNYWAALEVKASATATKQPNQDYYIDLMDGMSFAAFIFPENEEEVIYALQRSFQSRRPARIPKRQQVSLGELRR